MSENATTAILRRRKLREFLETFNKHKKIIDVGVIVAISIVVFSKAFSNYYMMNYIDGGYYVLEVKTLINSGKLYYNRRCRKMVK